MGTEAVRVVVINCLLMAVQYLVLAGLAWWGLYHALRVRMAHRKILQGGPRHGQVPRELRYSLASVVIFSLALAMAWGCSLKGWNRFYWDLRRHGLGWLAFSTVLTIVLWDAWFYWTHRAMHHPRLFRWFHRTHHLSSNPTPWTTYSVDPLEAVVYALFVVLVSFLYPVHPLGMVAFMAFQFLWNLGSHSGFEFMPGWFPASWTSWWLSSPTSHVLHHETGRGNFGFCFQFWDRLMGTCHPEYDDRLRTVVRRSAAAGPGTEMP